MKLQLRDVHAAYGATPVLFGVSLEVAPGEVVALMGRNGMGKTTTIRALMGLNPPTHGEVLLDGRDMAGRPPHEIAARGIGLVPEGRMIFPRLSVEENLLATARGTGGWTLDAVYALFPPLAARRGHAGNRISGGEQQMLAIGRALMTNPALLVLDEATEGLAPLLRAAIWEAVGTLKERGLSILVVDKHVGALRRVADRFVMIEKGRVVWSGDRAALDAGQDAVARYLGV
ncbi:MAG: ABC transporter ATP-binding protein [Flavobacteriaceae bacterium]